MIPRTLEHNLAAPSVPPMARRLSPTSDGPPAWSGSLSRWLASDAAETFSRRLALVLMPAVALMIGVAAYRGAYRAGEIAGAHETRRLAATLELVQRRAERMAETTRIDGQTIASLQTQIVDCERKRSKKAKRR